MLSAAARAQTGSGAAGRRPRSPRATGTIERYEYHPDLDIPLTIYYNDGATLSVKPECGREASDRGCLAQTDFTNIQVSEDRKRIGWLLTT